MNLAKFHYELLSYLTHHNYSSGLELQNVFPNQKLRVEESIKYLYEQQLIVFTTAINEDIYFDVRDREADLLKKLGFDMAWRCRITELGHLFLEEHEKTEEEMNIMRKQLDTDHIEIQLSKRSFWVSTTIAIISLIISIVAIVH